MKINEAIEIANQSRSLPGFHFPSRPTERKKKGIRLSLSFDTPQECRPGEFNLWKSQQIATGFVARRWLPFHGGFLINKNNHRAPRGIRIRDIAFVSPHPASGNQKESCHFFSLFLSFFPSSLLDTCIFFRTDILRGNYLSCIPSTYTTR